MWTRLWPTRVCLTNNVAPIASRLPDSSTRRCSLPATKPAVTERLSHGLDAPICLTWELTYGCNLACVHCLSSSGKRDPRELTTDELFGVVDELAAMQVFYVNIGGGEPTLRPDFWDLLDYSVESKVGVKFSTNGSRITPPAASPTAGTGYSHVAISIDGPDAA